VVSGLDGFLAVLRFLAGGPGIFVSEVAGGGATVGPFCPGGSSGGGGGGEGGFSGTRTVTAGGTITGAGGFFRRQEQQTTAAHSMIAATRFVRAVMENLRLQERAGSGGGHTSEGATKSPAAEAPFCASSSKACLGQRKPALSDMCGFWKT
jgi:hypothetical protein